MDWQLDNHFGELHERNTTSMGRSHDRATHFKQPAEGYLRGIDSSLWAVAYFSGPDLAIIPQILLSQQIAS